MAKIVTDEQIANALRKCGGIIVAAATVVNLHRNTVASRIKKNDELQAIVNDSRETLIDHAEKQLFAKVKRGDIKAILFTLKTIGRHRGYVQRHESQISGPDGDAIPHEVRQAAISNEDSLQLLSETLEKALVLQESNSGSTE